MPRFENICGRLIVSHLAIAFTLAGAGDYADPALCTQCHPKIAGTYRQNGMGRSFFRPAPSNKLEDFGAKPFYHAPSDTWYAMIERDGAYFQRRWQIGFDGKETSIEVKRIDFVLGSGDHGRTYLHLTERNTLQQLPLGWYAEKGGYFAMNPGYDRPDYPGSVRAITYKCMFCHNAYPGIPEGHDEDGAEAQFTSVGEGIDCQRCHGPGRKHAETTNRADIVNPARLGPERAMDVCLQCHLEPTSRMLPGALQRKGRAPFSYVPGQALSDFRLAFDRATPDTNDFEVAQAGYRFLQSQCWLKSAGKLLCTTCHDPHTQTAAVGYNAICRNCHAAAHPVAVASTDCVACHMPKRRTSDAVHIVMTDHRIQRRPPPADPLADKPEVPETPASAYRGEVVPFYPSHLAASAANALDRAVAQIKDRSNVKQGLPQLASLLARYRPAEAAYYEELADGYRAAGDGARAVPYYEEAVRRAPASSLPLLRLGNMLMDLRQFPRAETVLRRATVLAPDDPLAWGLLGWVLYQQDKNADAKTSLRKAVELDPELADVRNYFGSLLAGTGDRAGAEEQFRAALDLEPGIAEWQANLGNLLASRGAFPEASYRLRQSIRLKPDDVAVRVTYARLLSDMGQSNEAETEAKSIVEAFPGAAQARECLGFLLAARGDNTGALRELKEAVRLLPGFGLAQYELGVALWQGGDVATGEEHLRIALRSIDTRVSAAAQDFLRKSGR